MKSDWGNILYDILYKSRLEWSDHVIQKDSHRISGTALDIDVNSWRPIGRCDRWG